MDNNIHDIDEIAIKAYNYVNVSIKDNTISNVHFYYDKNIEDTIESLESEWQIIVFWIFWILLIGGLVVGFYVIDNKWLEDKKK